MEHGFIPVQSTKMTVWAICMFEKQECGWRRGTESHKDFLSKTKERHPMERALLTRAGVEVLATASSGEGEGLRSGWEQSAHLTHFLRGEEGRAECNTVLLIRHMWIGFKISLLVVESK